MCDPILLQHLLIDFTSVAQDVYLSCCNSPGCGKLSHQASNTGPKLYHIGVQDYEGQYTAIPIDVSLLLKTRQIQVDVDGLK